jgi:hypothetical protein
VPPSINAGFDFFRRCSVEVAEHRLRRKRACNSGTSVMTKQNESKFALVEAVADPLAAHLHCLWDKAGPGFTSRTSVVVAPWP